MMVVIADTSPLNYLVQIGEIDLLPRLYGTIVIPTEVFLELKDAAAPAIVHEWMSKSPAWLEIRPAADLVTSSFLFELDAGEQAAIQLAQLEDESLLLIDDAAGRRAAQSLGLPNVGTLGVLRLAALEGLVDLPTILAKLMRTNFRAPAVLIQQLIAEDEARRD
jgi:predicted nucleic acid-binding protein